MIFLAVKQATTGYSVYAVLFLWDRSPSLPSAKNASRDRTFHFVALLRHVEKSDFKFAWTSGWISKYYWNYWIAVWQETKIYTLKNNQKTVRVRSCRKGNKKKRSSNVSDKTKQTLLPIIESKLQTGSTIFHDDWAAYRTIHEWLCWWNNRSSLWICVSWRCKHEHNRRYFL